MNISKKEKEQILFAAITANTASYLLKRLRNSRQLQTTAREISFVELMRFAKQLFSEQFSTDNQFALAYSILGIASFLNQNKRNELLSVCDTSKLDWGVQLIEEMEKYKAPAVIQKAIASVKPQTIPSLKNGTTMYITKRDQPVSQIVNYETITNSTTQSTITEKSF